MLIGELVKKSGLTKDTIRYYEKIGIFNSRVVQRNPMNGYKNYSDEVLEVVKMLEIGKQHGCTLNEIREIVESHQQNELTCFSIAPYIHKKLKEVNQKINDLELKKARLEMALINLQSCYDDSMDKTIQAYEL